MLLVPRPALNIKQSPKEKGDTFMKIQEDKTFDYTYDDMSSNRIVAAISVIPVLFWIKLLMGDSKYINFYANQGCFLLIVGVVMNIILAIVRNVPFFGGIIGWLFGIIDGILGIITIFQIINALRMKAKTLPIVGDISII